MPTDKEKSANFTVSFPDTLLRQGKVLAARCDTSLNAILRELLRNAVESHGRVGNAGQHYRTLVQFALGQIDREEAKAALGIDGDVPLFIVLANAGLPTPSLPQEEIERMAATLERVMQACAS